VTCHFNVSDTKTVYSRVLSYEITVQ